MMRDQRASRPSRRHALAGGAAALACGAASRPVRAMAEETAAVPPEFAKLYAALEAQLDETLAKLPADSPHRPKRFGHLMSISGHRPADALAPGWREFHTLYAKGFKELGVEGVEMEVSYPTFTPAFNKQLDAYLESYRYVGQLARDMGRTVVAKHNPVVPRLSLLDVKPFYEGLTKERFFAERYDEALKILDVIDPDYFILCGEPGNIPPVDGHRMTVEDWRDYHTTFTERLRNDRPNSKAKFGAAAGTWESSELFDMFAEVKGLDLVDLHFYPVRGGRNGDIDLVTRAIDWVEAVRRKRPEMGVVIGEAWLFKTTPAEQVEGATAPEIFGRDLWSFWSPLDIKMLEAVKRVGALTGADYVSPFWTHLFFAYQDYASGSTTSIMEQRQLLNAKMLEALRAGRTTATGRAFAS